MGGAYIILATGALIFVGFSGLWSLRPKDRVLAITILLTWISCSVIVLSTDEEGRGFPASTASLVTGGLYQLPAGEVPYADQKGYRTRLITPTSVREFLLPDKLQPGWYLVTKTGEGKIEFTKTAAKVN